MWNLRYRLALDLGSTSLGWALFRLDVCNRPMAIIKAGVRIFSDGRNPKDGASLAVARRAARAMRRRRDRLLKRKARMQTKLVEHGFFPAGIDARKALERLDPYALRAKGLREALAPGEFARALFHINQRRGFKSNRKTDKKDNDSGALKKAITQLRQQMVEQGSRTVGEYLWARLQRGQGVRARYREKPFTTDEGKKRIDKSYDLYIDRAMIEQEFDALWAAQATFNPALFHEAARADLKDTLLHQRRLRPVKPGRCTLLPEEERAPLALPSTQRFRIYQEVNHLRLLDESLCEMALTLEQRDAVAAALESKAKLSFEQIRKLLKLSGSVQFNLEDAKRTELKGNATSAALARKELFGAAWSGFDAALQDEIVWQLVPLRKRYRFASDGYERWLGDDKDFLARALNDTRYLSRVAAEYLRLVCPGSSTRVIPGQMTALLRAKFGLNDVLGLDGEKNRNDHRHHAVDACVIGVTDQGLMQRFATASAQAREGGLTRLVEDMPMPWPTYREHVERAVRHIWVSHRPDHGFEGAMMEETSYGIRKDGTIKQRRKADGSAGREISNLIRIHEAAQPLRHGVSADGQPLAYKGYVGGSNYCIEITVNDKGKWEGEVISTFQAYGIVRAGGMRRLRNPREGQNGRKLVMRLMIGDSVRLEVDGAERTMRVVKISGSNGQVFMAPIHEANVDARNTDKQDTFAYTSKYAGSLQKANARCITISPIGELRDPGFTG